MHHRDLTFMREALSLAEQGQYTVSPNPMVGCVIVRDDNIIGCGYHQRAGAAHAEIHALQDAGSSSQGATAYINLEPCCHHGRTGPCTDALIKAGIKKVFIATLDPNPLVAGKGVTQLEDAGIEVEVGICESAARELNQIFFHYMQTRRPFVIAKWAMSLDGKTIANESDAATISSKHSLEFSHAIRNQVDAIIIGSKTAKKDNPQLTVRHADVELIKHPLRIIVSAQCSLPLDLKLLQSDLPGKTIIATTQATDPDWIAQAKQQGIEILIFPQNQLDQVDLPSLLTTLGQREITSVLIEGGMTLHDSFMRENLINQLYVNMAPCIIGPWQQKKYFSKVKQQSLGNDYLYSVNFDNVIAKSTRAVQMEPELV